MGIIYRDIKLENILLDANGHIVLTDFGLSKELLPGKNERAYSFCGTIEYMAPEVVKGGSTGHDIAVDWWSVGVLTYELLTGASPFTVEGERNTQQDISRRILRTQPPIPDTLGDEVKDFILKLLVKDPRRRLGKCFEYREKRVLYYSYNYFFLNKNYIHFFYSFRWWSIRCNRNKSASLFPQHKLGFISEKTNTCTICTCHT